MQTVEKEKFDISFNYNKDFVQLWNKLKEKYPDKLFKIQGVHNDNFDISKFSKDFFQKSASVASVSVDANANVKEKSIAQYVQEYPKGIQRLNSFYLMYKWVKKFFGTKSAHEAVEKVLNGELFVNDFSNFSEAYCYAFDLRMLLMEGMSFFHGGMKINAPKRSDSFVALLIQTTAFISNQIMGACSYPDCFVAWDWFLRKEHGENYMQLVREGKTPAVKKKILDQFQNLIYSLNFPFRAAQSAFTNLSVMDMGYMKSLFSEYQLPDFTLPNLESAQDLSKLFFEYFDSINGKEGMFTFPVMSLSLSLTPDGEYIDPDFKKWVSEHNCNKSFSNVFIGEPDIYSSCCFAGNQLVKIQLNNQSIETSFEQLDKQYDFRNGTPINVWVGDNFKPAKFVKLTNVHTMYSLEFINDIKVICTGNHIFPTTQGDLTAEELYNLSLEKRPEFFMHNSNNVKLINIDIIQDCKPDFVYCVEMEDKKNPYFVLPSGLKVGNCRLSNNIKKAGGLGFQNSFGVGGLSIGSHRVAGLNLARISLLEQEHPNILEEDIEMLHKILYAHRNLIKDKIDRGVMPLYTSEWISINRQYSTIGVTACNQYVSNKGLDIKTDEGIQCIASVLKKIENKIEQWQADEVQENCIYNLEAIPAESVAVRLAQADKLLGYNHKYKIYSNQYIDLMEDCNVYDRIKVQGKLDQLTSGGNILHINIDGEKPLTPTQYEKIIDLAKESGVKYFGINYAYSECADKHYTIGKNETCPICGKPIVETWCRVVGFITPKSAFNPVRRDYEFDKRVFYSSDKIDEVHYENCQCH